MKAQFAFLHGRFPAVVMEREDGEGVDVHVLAINEVREQVEDADDYQLVGSPFTLSEPEPAEAEEPAAVAPAPEPPPAPAPPPPSGPPTTAVPTTL